MSNFEKNNYNVYKFKNNVNNLYFEDINAITSSVPCLHTVSFDPWAVVWSRPTEPFVGNIQQIVARVSHATSMGQWAMMGFVGVSVY